jgi:hypothetical protein
MLCGCCVLFQATGVWNQGRMTLWGAILLASLAFLAWDLKLADAWEDWCLTKRQAARIRGKKFTLQENMDDLTTLMLTGLQQQFKVVAEHQPQILAAGREQQQQQSEQQHSKQHTQQQQRQSGQNAQQHLVSQGRGQQQQQQAEFHVQPNQHDNGSSKPFSEGLQTFTLHPSSNQEQQEVVMLPEGGDAWVPDTTNRSSK